MHSSPWWHHKVPSHGWSRSSVRLCSELSARGFRSRLAENRAPPSINWGSFFFLLLLLEARSRLSAAAEIMRPLDIPNFTVCQHLSVGAHLPTALYALCRIKRSFGPVCLNFLWLPSLAPRAPSLWSASTGRAGKKKMSTCPRLTSAWRKLTRK